MIQAPAAEFLITCCARSARISGFWSSKSKDPECRKLIAHYRRQAHSYALENKSRYRHGRPFLYCLSNLEQTQLFGADDIPDLAVSLNARQIDSWNHSDFTATPEDEHRSIFKENFGELVSFAVGATVPVTYSLNFPIAWEAIEAAGKNTGASLPDDWSDSAANSWFSGFEEQDSKGLLLAIRCLFAEWIIYQCELHGHPDSAKLVHLQLKNNPSKTRNLVADALDRLLQIDFEAVIDGNTTTNDLPNINDVRALTAIRAVEQLQELELDQLSELVGNSGLRIYYSNFSKTALKRRVGARCKRIRACSGCCTNRLSQSLSRAISSDACRDRQLVSRGFLQVNDVDYGERPKDNRN